MAYTDYTSIDGSSMQKCVNAFVSPNFKGISNAVCAGGVIVGCIPSGVFILGAARYREDNNDFWSWPGELYIDGVRPTASKYVTSSKGYCVVEVKMTTNSLVQYDNRYTIWYIDPHMDNGLGLPTPQPAIASDGSIAERV